jgi:hypothetical protein
MKIYIEAKEVNVRITDNDNEEVFNYSTATYSVSMNITRFITTAMGLIKHMMGLEVKSKVETNVATATSRPTIGQPYFVISETGFDRYIWTNDADDLDRWQNCAGYTDFNDAINAFRARHYA